ncbi:O-antigen ligase family protein [Rugamonas sp. DEMB1]|uniref:O-antigen ligase family protein n=1 Tax=Rugamonas sp. DEMB1 TaxID=3039386 RepID=UPI002447C8D7|nr:O-antigen ligase family protein [Rugamonas sp. DEMB1]WGG51405.1 O-antigen ligase family protein [Rugamonas sp. DEMB1]
MNHTLSGPARGNSLLIHLLLFCLPFLTLISSFGVGLCSFAFLLAAVLTRREGMAALRRHWPQVRGVLLAFGLGLAFAVLLMVLRHGVHLRALEKPGRMLAAATVMLAVLACRPSRRALWWGLIAGAVAGAAFSVYQRWGMGMQRPGGLINSITFGDIVLCMGLMCLAAGSDFKGRQALWPALGALAGLVGSIATGTRGGWVAVLFAGVLMVSYGHVLRGRPRQCAALAALALLAASYFVPQTGARQRLEQGVADVQTYFGGGNAYSNMGVRLELWRGAAMLIERHPLSGAAAPQVKAELVELAAGGKLDPFVLQFDHFHNDIVQALVYGGVLGLLVWGATLLLPLLFFLRILRRRPDAAAGLLAPALAGALLVVCYFSFGLTEVIFWSVRSTMFYALMLFLLMGLCLNAQDEAAAAAAAPADKAAA